MPTIIDAKMQNDPPDHPKRGDSSNLDDLILNFKERHDELRLNRKRRLLKFAPDELCNPHRNSS